MARKPLGSTDASNGSAPGSVYGSDYTVGTLRHDEDWDHDIPNQRGQSMQDTRVFQVNQPLQEAHAYGDGPSSQENAWADKGVPVPSESPSPESMARFLKESDLRKEFLVRGHATGAQAIKQADRAGSEESITLSESHYGNSNESSRSNTVKNSNRGSGKSRERRVNEAVESKSESSPAKRRKRTTRKPSNSDNP